MKRRLSLFVIILTILALCLSGCAIKVHQNVPEKGTAFMWEVKAREGGGKLYLLGSIHVGKDDLYPLKPVITNAFESSDVLAVECDAMAALQRPDYMDLMAKLMYTDGTTVKDHIPADLYEKTDAFLKEKGLSLKLFSMFKPVVISDSILDLAMEEWGYSSDKGIDNYFIDLAREKGMELVEIESVDFQFDLLAGFSDEIQALDLEQTLNEIDSYGQTLDSMFSYWENGDVEHFEELIFEDDGSLTPEEEELYKAYEKQMYDDRNLHMADKAEEYLKTGKTTFFVVGSAHMVGETGIVNLLRERGYEVVQK